MIQTEKLEGERRERHSEALSIATPEVIADLTQNNQTAWHYPSVHKACTVSFETNQTISFLSTLQTMSTLLILCPYKVAAHQSKLRRKIGTASNLSTKHA